MFDSDLFDDDMAAVFSDWDTADYTPKAFAHPSVNTITVQGIFHYDFIEINGVMSNRPTFRVQTSIITDPENTDRLTLTNVVLDPLINNTDFVIREYQRWGNGETLLILSEYEP